MHDDIADHAMLKHQLERLEVLYAETERVRSSASLEAMRTVCRTARHIENPRYRYAIEQVGWIESALQEANSRSDLSPLHSAISRFRNSLRTLAPRTERERE